MNIFTYILLGLQLIGFVLSVKENIKSKEKTDLIITVFVHSIFATLIILSSVWK